MRPSSLWGGRIMRRTLSVCPSVCLSVRPVIVTERHVAPPSELQWHVLFGTRWGPHIARPSRPHKFLLLSCAKSHVVSQSTAASSASCKRSRPPSNLVSGQELTMCVTLSGFLHSHIVRCRWNPISCGTHYSGPGLSENDSAVTTDVCEDQNREVGLWSTTKVVLTTVADFQSSLHRLCDINWLHVPPQWFARFQAKWRRVIERRHHMATEHGVMLAGARAQHRSSGAVVTV